MDNGCSMVLTYAGAMNSFVTGVVRALVEFISTLSSSSNGPSTTDTATTRQESGPRSHPTTHTSSHSPKPSDRSRSHSSSQHQDPATSNRPRTSIREASIADALAHASYKPIMDGDADPGEVVWTWVPYQEDASVGKDRPAVVIGAQGEGVYLLQLTSKDHTRDAAQEAAAGRYWFDIGSGAWDQKGRPSEVRLDRALWVKATDVRREGSILPEVTWRRIVDALEEHYRTHGG